MNILVLTTSGINRSEENDQPSIQDFGRFSSLMQSTERATRAKFQIGSQSDRDSRTPSLVSFVGQTGAGKSTLIKLVIDLLTAEGEHVLPTPVVGTSGAHTPTSEDVHLYLDPCTALSDAPLLYADCEGLEGGEREPLGAVYRRNRWRAKQKESLSTENYVRSARVASERELAWADSPRKQSRDFVVANLYPRLLYTFSDVIVFVLKNPR
jgi:energy-coupling factor transporter ATP-binding protein EcfA2